MDALPVELIIKIGCYSGPKERFRLAWALGREVWDEFSDPYVETLFSVSRFGAEAVGEIAWSDALEISPVPNPAARKERIMTVVAMQ
jgi:hypothetical protein